MTREEELALLIEEQRKDDSTDIVYPDFNGDSWAGSLDASNGEGDPFSSAIGIVVDFETGKEEQVSFITRRHGAVLGWRDRQIHGVAKTYGQGCRCEKCRAASAGAMKKWRASRDSWHGTVSGYRRGCQCHECRRASHGTRYRYNKGCRCVRCTSANKQYQRRRAGLPQRIDHRPCACCGKKFKPWRHGKIYCTPRCASTGAQRAYRARKRAA